MMRIEIGWREWIELPELGLPSIKAKIDTGARTSALHAFDVTPYQHEGVLRVRFGIHPIQGNSDVVHYCDAEVIDQRPVTDSGGHREQRYVILSPIVMGQHTLPIEITLTNRDNMRFRMLIGRTSLADRFMVLPDASYLLARGPSLVTAHTNEQENV